MKPLPHFSSLVLFLFIAAFALGATSARAARPASQPSTPAAKESAATFPRIAMLWSKADLRENPWANWARHSIIVVGIEDLGLEWTASRYPALSETIDESTVAQARKNLRRVRQLNPHAVVLCELYFYEAGEKDYPQDSPWWLRDKTGKRSQFWPGCYDMDLSNKEYVQHVARQIAAVLQAMDGEVGIFLDNLRLDDVAKAGWKNLLNQVRRQFANVPVLVNAGWDSRDLEWVAPLVNGIVYEDSVAHTDDQVPGDKDTEKFYARITATDRLLRTPRLSINERFGHRKDETRMMRELLRTLVYTDMYYLYSDSTNGHKHAWWPAWNTPLGQAQGPAAVPAPGKLARRDFEGGTVLWLPADAKGAVTVKLDTPMTPLGKTHTVNEVTLQANSGAILLRVQP